MTSKGPAYCRGQLNGRVAAIVVVVAILVLLVLYLLPTGVDEVPESTPVPEAARPGLETVAPAETGAERGDRARELIAALQQDEAGDDLAEAYRRAREFRTDGRLADAQLLYFYAARGGHGPAAFDLATMYDPNQFSPETSLMAAPDPFQAYKWYRQAREAGRDEATDRLSRLRAWAEAAEAEGDAEAERLLMQWE